MYSSITNIVTSWLHLSHKCAYLLSGVSWRHARFVGGAWQLLCICMYAMTTTIIILIIILMNIINNNSSSYHHYHHRPCIINHSHPYHHHYFHHYFHHYYYHSTLLGMYITCCLIKLFTLATNTYEEQHRHIEGLQVRFVMLWNNVICMLFMFVKVSL